MRFLFILLLSVGGHLGFACWWMTPTTQEPKLLLRYGKVSVELMPVQSSAPSVAKPAKREKRDKPVKKIPPSSTKDQKKLPTKNNAKSTELKTKPQPKTPNRVETLPKPSMIKKRIVPKEKPITKPRPKPPKEIKPPAKINPQKKIKLLPKNPTNPTPKKQNESKSRPKASPRQPKSMGVTTAARLGANQRLTYPYEARRKGIQGRVVLRLRISKIGKVLKVELVKSSGSRILDNAAVQAAYRLQFLPAKRDGKNVESTLEQGFNYRLQ